MTMLHAAPSGATLPRERTPAAPHLTLVELLRRAGALLKGLPERAWVEAAVIACRAFTYGHTLELADTGQGAPTAALRVFLNASARTSIARALGAPFDPAALVGMTTTLLVEAIAHPASR